MSVRFRFLVLLCLLPAANGLLAQHNVYIGENNRVRIVNSVDKIACGPDDVTLWSDTAVYLFSVPSVSLMSLSEKDSWRSKVMPERYLNDFDYDIAFEDGDDQRIKAEHEVADIASEQYDDFVEHSVWSKTVSIVYSGTDVEVTGDIDSLDLTKEGAHLTINTPATGVKYILSGTSSDASFKLYSECKACLVLNGVNLTNPVGPVINSQLKKRLFVVIRENTVNTLADGASYTKVKGEDQRGCVFAEGKICVSGQGKLYITANKKCGIASDKYIHMIDGFVHVDACAEKGKAVYGQNNVIIGGGVLRTYCCGAASKGVASDSLIWIKGGVIKAITTGDAVWVEDEEDYSSCCGIKSMWDMVISGGEIYCLSTGTGGKGISAGNSETVSETKTVYNGTLTIADADIFVRTGGRRIPEVKTEDSHGNKTGASASPKGIKSAGKMFLNSGNVYVRCSGGVSAEGIESKKTIDINGGKIRCYSVDDGMNAEGCYMYGGDVLFCSTENDGFDVSFLYMFDGLLYTIGGDVDQMGLDTDGKTFKVMGGEILSLGARNCQPYESGTLASVLCYVKKNVNGVALADSDGNVIRAVPTPDSYDTVCVLFSNDKICVGDRYKIYSYEKSLNDQPVVEYDFVAEGISTVLGSFR